MLQIENEYGYLERDRAWPTMLKAMWDKTPLKLKQYQAEPYTGMR